MLYIHLDEVNHLYNEDPSIFKTAIRLLSMYLSTPPEGFFYFVLFTGTAYTQMRNLGVSESFPLVELLMKVLDKNGAIFIPPLFCYV
jgi:hypothetical protein